MGACRVGRLGGAYRWPEGQTGTRSRQRGVIQGGASAGLWSGGKHPPQILCSDTVPGHLFPVQQEYGNIVAVPPFKGDVGRDVDLGKHECSASTKSGNDRLHLVTQMAARPGIQCEFHTEATSGQPSIVYGRAEVSLIWRLRARAASRGSGDAIMGRPTTR